MFRSGVPANPYGQNAPFNAPDSQFRSPGPKMQGSPRQHGHQQSFNNSMNSQNRSMRSPNYYPSPNNGSRMNYSSPYGSGNRSFSPRHTPPYGDRGTPYNRGYFQDHRGRGGRGRHSYGQYPGTPRSDSEQNPGGSNDISQYYKHCMIEDPWKNLQPIPVTKSMSTTT